ncbi:TPA: F-box protein [Legionella pneumophila]|nr:F-box protein [Legionella pneumophila]
MAFEIKVDIYAALSGQIKKIDAEVESAKADSSLQYRHFEAKKMPYYPHKTFNGSYVPRHSLLYGLMDAYEVNEFKYNGSHYHREKPTQSPAKIDQKFVGKFIQDHPLFIFISTIGGPALGGLAGFGLMAVLIAASVVTLPALGLGLAIICISIAVGTLISGAIFGVQLNKKFNAEQELKRRREEREKAKLYVEKVRKFVNSDLYKNKLEAVKKDVMAARERLSKLDNTLKELNDLSVSEFANTQIIDAKNEWNSLYDKCDQSLVLSRFHDDIDSWLMTHDDINQSELDNISTIAYNRTYIEGHIDNLEYDLRRATRFAVKSHVAKQCENLRNAVSKYKNHEFYEFLQPLLNAINSFSDSIKNNINEDWSNFDDKMRKTMIDIPLANLAECLQLELAILDAYKTKSQNLVRYYQGQLTSLFPSAFTPMTEISFNDEKFQDEYTAIVAKRDETINAIMNDSMQSIMSVDEIKKSCKNLCGARLASMNRNLPQAKNESGMLSKEKIEEVKQEEIKNADKFGQNEQKKLHNILSKLPPQAIKACNDNIDVVSKDAECKIEELMRRANESRRKATRLVSQLPKEMLLKIFGFFDEEKDLHASQLVCAKWNEAGQGPSQIS